MYKYTTFHIANILYICFEDWMIYCCQLDGKCTQFISFTQDTTEPLIYKDLQRDRSYWCTADSSCCCCYCYCCCALFISLNRLRRAHALASLPIVWSYLISVSTLSIILSFCFHWNLMPLQGLAFDVENFTLYQSTTIINK